MLAGKVGFMHTFEVGFMPINDVVWINIMHKAYSKYAMEDKPIVFEDWEQALMTSVPPDRRRAYREAIVKFRYWIRQTGKLSNIETFKEHLSWKQSYLSPERFELRRASRKTA